MKKTIFVLLLVLTMVSSIVAGTLAMYTASIDNLGEGSVVAKEFVFVGDGTDSFQHGIKIAPTEIVRWQFKVKNYQNYVITETDLYYKLTFNVLAVQGKAAIQPLTVAVKDSQGNVLKSVTGTGTFDVLGSFPLSEVGQENEYEVEIYWPDGGPVDIDYAGNNYGTAVKVDAIASQLPLSEGHENPPEQKDVSIRYETLTPWQNGQSGIYQFEYKVTITNNSDEAIKDWSVAFSLSTDRITQAWSNAKMVAGLPEGMYKFENPGYNNQSTDNILPGQSVSFRGPAYGMGTHAIGNIIVGGSNVSDIGDIDLTCEFGKSSLN
ncbi:cellulose binding domain-containing protein [Anaerobacterium chartisolvens]|uniref:Cellulose binding domain-containing protein n=1 Tax=Anaerobacterium chartisolvens TaxID=1297424 RepID=A0A369BKG2_9FIRM|nr:cellulose binding domain-containing protein [Anaerobacterium chartisolvens]RCX20184.1 cellulose binding domain-containing protein [Anaerobacterium chartisolvens]